MTYHFNQFHRFIGLVTICLFSAFQAIASPHHNHTSSSLKFIQVKASDSAKRTLIAETGMTIEHVRSDSVWGFADPEALKLLQSDRQFKILGVHDIAAARGGHGVLDFPGYDSKFHNFKELTDALTKITDANPDVSRLRSVGKSLEGRDIWAVHINSDAKDLEEGKSNRPGIIFMGNHHAREHLSAELPLKVIQHILNNKNDQKIAELIKTRDIWFIPMVNPDGVEYDISKSRYAMWRKNRRNNKDGTFGVDLNRNYAYGFGGRGSSGRTSSQTYRGPLAFSEPETQVMKRFVEDHLNATVLISFHTYSELILYPWGHKTESIRKKKDLRILETMAKEMATWNKYRPMQASGLYVASGDTTDWAYGEHGIYAFTFELSPGSIWQGGFYPGQQYIDKVFQDNLKPCLYAIDVAGDPTQVLTKRKSNPFLKSFPAQAVDLKKKWDQYTW